MGLVSRVYHMANADPPRGVEAERRNREAMQELWRRRGIAALDPEDIRDEWLRQAVINEATRQFGRRGR